MALVVALAVVISYVAFEVARAYQGWRKPVFVEIAPGTSSRAIAAQLQSAGVLRQRWPFLLLHHLHPRERLQAGEYLFDRALSPREVLRKLARGEIYYHSITIPEGFNMFEVVEAVAASGLVSRQDVQMAVRNTAPISDLDPFARDLEGYLFPDTYHFPRHVSADDIVAAMVARFRKVYRELAARYKPPHLVHEVVIMASLIEKETGVPGERPLVASVLNNRAEARLPLQCDPTVIYAAIRASRYRGAIYQRDLDYDSPYNTYMRRGLPPGPIANAGRASLEAAMAPAATDYLYFVSNGHNSHRFSRTLKEHARAVAQYRRHK